STMIRLPSSKREQRPMKVWSSFVSTTQVLPWNSFMRFCGSCMTWRSLTNAILSHGARLRFAFGLADHGVLQLGVFAAQVLGYSFRVAAFKHMARDVTHRLTLLEDVHARAARRRLRKQTAHGRHGVNI